MDILFCVVVCIALVVSKIRGIASDWKYNNQTNARKAEYERFTARFGADDEMVSEALYQELDKTEFAETIRLRLLSEAAVDTEMLTNWCIYRFYLVILGILAQSGKIPITFIDGGIDWAKDCYLISSQTHHHEEARKMMERFIRWYDKELTDHGVTEHLFQKKKHVQFFDSLTDTGYLQQATDVRKLNYILSETNVSVIDAIIGAGKTSWAILPYRHFTQCG